MFGSKRNIFYPADNLMGVAPKPRCSKYETAPSDKHQVANPPTQRVKRIFFIFVTNSRNENEFVMGS